MLLEPASSLTDFALGTMALAVALRLGGTGHVHWQWRAVFAIIGVAAVWGGVHHGFLVSGERLSHASWSATSMLIAIAISFLLAGSVASVLGQGRGRPLLALRTLSLAAFFVLVILGRATIPLLMITEGLAMIMVLALWLHAWHTQQPGAGLVLVAIAMSMLAGAVRGTPVHFSLAGWEFDRNALYHMAQMPGLVVLWLALVRHSRGLEESRIAGPVLLSPT